MKIKYPFYTMETYINFEVVVKLLKQLQASDLKLICLFTITTTATN